MFKAIILLTRREDTSPDEFRRWWLDEHAPLARMLPGCRRLVFNVVEPPAPAVPGTAAPEPPCDGVSELWFDSREAFDAAYATELGRRVTADTLAHVRSRVRLVVEEHLQVGDGPSDAESPARSLPPR